MVLDGFISCRSRYHLRFGSLVWDQDPSARHWHFRGLRVALPSTSGPPNPFFCQKQGRAKAPEKGKKQTAASAAAWKRSLSQKASPGF